MTGIIIDGEQIAAAPGKSVLTAALEAGVYIPHLCYHPQLESSPDSASLEKTFQGEIECIGKGGITLEGCNLCLVEIEGKEGTVRSCKIPIEEGMSVRTSSDAVRQAREEYLTRILRSHPHACLLCAQAEGCDRRVCSQQIPEAERCCDKFGICELQKVADYIGIDKGLPPYTSSHIPVAEAEPLIRRDYNLCIGCLRCVKICKDVRGADALSFTVDGRRPVAGAKAATMKEAGCQFCGFCVEVCPTGALMDKDLRPGKREAQLVPCQSQCPAGIDVPRYVRLIAAGKIDQAAKVVREKVPFPAVLGRVCFHPCETVCRRGSIDQPVAICALKRTAADLGGEPALPAPVREKTGKRVAVVGSGPAGLTAAYYLAVLGHGVTVFEALPEAGGMLRVGIPAYRLPRQVLDGEIKAVEAAGVEIRTGTPVQDIDALLAGGFDAAFVAVGAHRGVKMGIPGEDAPGVIEGVTFLKNLNLGRPDALGEKIAVIGGGNVAVDAARSALRLGGKEATVFYRRTRAEMPAHDEEIEAALEEGVHVAFLAGPKSIEKTEKGFEVAFVRMEMGEADESGRRRPIPQEGSDYRLSFDRVIAAVGQEAEVPQGVATVGLQRRRPALEVDAGRGIFAGGDMTTGPGTVIEAIAGGRQGASLIDKFLGGDGNISQVLAATFVPPLAAIRTPYVDENRAQPPRLPVSERCEGFAEVVSGFEESAALCESGRCLACSLRLRIKPPVLPPERLTVFTLENVQGLPEREGVYTLYDGAKEIYKISGVENLRRSLLEDCRAGDKAGYFAYEEDPMYTMKERQLVQQYMKKHGSMPPGNMELDDLF